MPNPCPTYSHAVPKIVGSFESVGDLAILRSAIRGPVLIDQRGTDAGMSHPAQSSLVLAPVAAAR